MAIAFVSSTSTPLRTVQSISGHSCPTSKTSLDSLLPTSTFICRQNCSIFPPRTRCFTAPNDSTRGCTAIQMTHPTSATGSTTTTVRDFLDSAGASGLGTVRFIALTGGAVLETIGRFDYNISTFSVPGKGEYVTLATEDKTFECHINTSKVHSITMSQEKAKKGDHDLYVIRMKGESGNIVLSCLLMWDPSKGPGNYLFGALDGFNRLKQKYGDEITIISQ